MNASDLLVLLLSAGSFAIAAALHWQTTSGLNADEVLPDENLLAAIDYHARPLDSAAHAEI